MKRHTILIAILLALVALGLVVLIWFRSIEAFIKFFI